MFCDCKVQNKVIGSVCFECFVREGGADTPAAKLPAPAYYNTEKVMTNAAMAKYRQRAHQHAPNGYARTSEYEFWTRERLQTLLADDPEALDPRFEHAATAMREKRLKLRGTIDFPLLP